jgi:hypothetical protein
VPWSPLSTPDGQGREPPPVELKGLLDQVLSGLGGPGVDALVVIHERWAAVVGDEVAGVCRPLGIDGATLKIAADNAAWASHIRWAQAEILDRLEGLLGSRQVTAVTVRVGRS